MNEVYCASCMHFVSGENIFCNYCKDKSMYQDKELHDAVNSPAHYSTGRKYEQIDVITDWELNFNVGNAMKYAARYKLKGTPLTDIRKAIKYLQYEEQLLIEKGEIK